MDEFQKLLKENKNMPKDQPGKFELRKMERDSTGKERYYKTEEDDAMNKAKIQQMGVDAGNELKGTNYEERCEWIKNQK
jgi:hypothetical protein